MKKILSLLIISMLMVFVACGPGQKQLTPEEKATQDSIAKVTQDSLDFINNLQTFIKSVNENKNLDNYIHKSIGEYVYTNPGAVCVATKSNKTENMDGIKGISENNIFNRKPKGEFCAGYPGEKDGFYFFEITKEELPSYYDAATNTDKILVLPANLNYTKFIKVNIIKGENFKLDLYFTCIDSTWYLIVQSFCDCSA